MTARTSLIAYYRVSTQRQGQSGLGLEAQRAAVAEHARRSGSAIAAEYTEVESGRKCDRPQLRAAVARAKAEGAILAVAKLDRLARDARFVLELVDSGARILFLDLPDLPANDPIIGRLILTMMAAVAEFEARRIGQRVKEALAAYKARGGKLGAADPRCPGFLARTAAQQRSHSLMGAAANRTRAAEFRLRVRGIALGLKGEGKSLSEIAREMNAKGLRTRYGKAWTQGLVHALLK